MRTCTKAGFSMDPRTLTPPFRSLSYKDEVSVNIKGVFNEVPISANVNTASTITRDL
jgi:hypothetical protein